MWTVSYRLGLGFVFDGYESAYTTSIVIATFHIYADDEFTLWWVNCISVVFAYTAYSIHWSLTKFDVNIIVTEISVSREWYV